MKNKEEIIKFEEFKSGFLKRTRKHENKKRGNKKKKRENKDKIHENMIKFHAE